MPKVPKKRPFWDPFLTLFVTLAKGVFRGSILPLICGCNGLFWPSGQKGEKGVKKGSKMAKKGSFYHFLTLFGRFIVLFWGTVLSKRSDFGKTACSKLSFFSEKVVEKCSSPTKIVLFRALLDPLFAGMPNRPRGSHTFICLFDHFKDVTYNHEIVNKTGCWKWPFWIVIYRKGACF
jgi:hypothetical protein